jgi:hypothetical protein
LTHLFENVFDRQVRLCAFDNPNAESTVISQQESAVTSLAFSGAYEYLAIGCKSGKVSNEFSATNVEKNERRMVLAAQMEV